MIQISRVEAGPGFNSEVWAQASWHNGFTTFRNPRQPAEVGTSFAMVHDGEFVHVAIRCDEPQIDRLAARKADDATSIFSGDHVEVFIDAASAAEGCVQIGVNRYGDVAGVWYRGNAQVMGFETGASAAAQVQNGGWNAQVALPLSTLGLKPQADSWRVNVTRVRVLDGATVQLSTFVPLDGESFYQPLVFVSAHVIDLDVDPFFLDVRLHGVAGVHDEGDGLVLRQTVKVANLGDTARDVSVTARLSTETAPNGPVAVHVDARVSSVQTLKLSTATEAFDLLHVDVSEKGRTVCRRTLRLEDQELSWKVHHVLQGDGKRGFKVLDARYRFLPRDGEAKVVPYGLAEMDNGQIILGGSAMRPSSVKYAVLAFSDDGGATWSDYQRLNADCGGIPMMLTYLGGPTLCFRAGWGSDLHRYYSHDYGRTWPEKVPVPRTPAGRSIECEGNLLVDRDEHGVATLLGETGQASAQLGENVERRVTPGCVHWSRDGGRTWENFSYPQAWQWQDTFAGETIRRGSGEGALVRAANGWIVAAMRMGVGARYVKYGYDNFSGIGVSISKDEGTTWSPICRVCDAGRMHANLLRMPDGALIMTVIRRLDIRRDRLHSYRRGCDALISRDHGLTWSMDDLIILDDWPHLDPNQWYAVACGHVCSTVLHDGTILTAYSKHEFGGVLVHWKPD